MARYNFGGDMASFIIQAPSGQSGVVKSQPNATGSVYAARTGGSALTDLLNAAGGAATTISSDADGFINRFQGPDGYTDLWADFGGASRFHMRCIEGPAISGALVINVKDQTYGAKGDGSTDDTTAIQAAINVAAASAVGAVVQFPPGQYIINSTLTISTNDVKLVGTSGNGSLIVVNGNFDAVTFSAGINRCQIKDLWIGSFSARASGWGIKINGSVGSQSAYFDFQNVTIQNTFGGIYAAYLNQSTWRNIRVFRTISGGIADVGISLIGVKSHRIASFFVTGVGGTTGTHGILLDSDCDTILLSDGEVIAAGGDGVRFTNSIGGSSTGPRLVFMTRMLVESCTSNGYDLISGRYAKMEQCWAAGNTLDGFVGAGIDGADFTTCEANQNGQHGFHFSSGGPYSVVNCAGNFNSQTTDATYNGVQIDANVTHVRVAASRLGNWLFSLTNGQKYGVRVESTGTNHVIVDANDLQGNRTASASWLTAATTNRARGNIGFNPVGNFAAPSIPATTVAQGNNFGFDCTVHVTGGTVTAVAVGGVSTGLTSGAFRVPAGQSITLTYSVAPTWTWFGD